jgi:hypothetical protein
MHSSIVSAGISSAHHTSFSVTPNCTPFCTTPKLKFSESPMSDASVQQTVSLSQYQLAYAPHDVSFLRQHRTIDQTKKEWYNRDMERQMTLAELNDELGAARTNKKEFLDKLESIIPWDNFIKIIQPSYYKERL